MLLMNDSVPIQVEMLARVNEMNFQNVVYDCCGLVMILKFGMQHSRWYGIKTDEELIKALAQKMSSMWPFLWRCCAVSQAHGEALYRCCIICLCSVL